VLVRGAYLSEVEVTNTELPPGAADGAGTPPVHDDAVPDDLVSVGRVAGAYGIKGMVRVVPFNAPESSVLRKVRDWWLSTGLPRAVRAESARVHSDAIVCRIHGVDDRNQAEALKGAEVLVRRSAFPSSADDEVYWTDLIGCRVRTPEGVDLGRVASVDEYGADPVLHLVHGEGQSRLIPFVAAWIVSVDTSAREIVADWQPDY
jgi:16S rRNA processing protein RimM